MSFQSIVTRPYTWAACAVVVLHGSSATAQFVTASAAPANYAATQKQAPVYQQAAPYQQTTQQRAPQQTAVVPQQAANYQQAQPPQQAVAAQHPMYAYTQQQPAYRVAQNHIPPVQNVPAAPAEVITPEHVPHQGVQTDTTDWSNFATTGAGCQDCATGVAGCGDAACATGCGDSCLTGVGCGPRRQWFAGFYGLYLKRDNPGRASLAFMVQDETAVTLPDYYPDNTVSFLHTNNADVDGQWGGEVRFGATFGGWGGGYGCGDTCGCGYQPFAWEVGYWGLDEEETSTSMTIDAPITAGADPRIYGTLDMGGLRYDRDGVGGGTYSWRPLNEYLDYQKPVNNPAPDDIRVVGVRMRTTFEIQNVELNFWKFGTPSCATCGPRLGGRLGGNSCRPPRRFFINGLCGVRYMRIDEDIFTDWQISEVTGGVPNAGEVSAYNGIPELFYDIETDNQLVGFQLGCSMNWLVGCKWNFFADSNLGVYGNQIDVYQRVYSANGDVQFTGTGGNAAVRSSKSDFAMLGEARVGLGYQLTCNCRATAAFRMIAISGVALGVEQIPANFSNAELVGYIDSNDSIVLHGVQTGLEWKY